ncbi:MAG: hypothetical protein R3Y54_11220 [Eubacteriales bacterium]
MERKLKDLKRQFYKELKIDESMSVLEQECHYKNDTNPIDCDVSELAMEVYESSYHFLSGGEISLQKEGVDSYHLYQIKAKDGLVYGGDTMNSYATAIHEYLRLFGNDGSKKKLVVDGKSKKLCFPKPQYKTWEDYILENLEDVEDTLGEDGILYISVRHSIGNMIPVPLKCFNAPRYPRTKDFWDLTLLCLYQWYQSHEEVERRDDIYLVQLVGEANVMETKSWLKHFPMWSDFVVMNYMEPFVEEGKPKMFWEGHSLEKIMPETKEEFQNFFKNAVFGIRERERLLIERVKINFHRQRL